MTTLIAGAAIGLVLWRLGELLQQQRQRALIQQIIATFGPASAAVQQDPKQLLVWYPIARASRKLFPDAFKALDDASGGAFPFTKEQIQAAHARWSADWLAWERAHDGEYKLRAAAAQEELGERAASAYGRSRLESIEREKLERYQQRYEEYTRVSKALQTLSAGSSRS